jgi:RNA polymerase sigma-70 factor (ECF subfamily)
MIVLDNSQNSQSNLVFRDPLFFLHPTNNSNTAPMIESPPITDEQLARSAQQGELPAFIKLYERYLPLVYNRVRALIPEQDVEDVTQEIFITVMKALPGFRGQSRFSTWLRTLINRRIVDYYRRRREPEAMIDLDHGSHHTGTRGSMDELVALRSVLRKLPDKYKEIILLRFAEGLSFDEIAHQTGSTLEAAKSLFRRAMAALRKEWDQYYE